MADPEEEKSRRRAEETELPEEKPAKEEKAEEVIKAGAEQLNEKGEAELEFDEKQAAEIFKALIEKIIGKYSDIVQGKVEELEVDLKTGKVKGKMQVTKPEIGEVNASFILTEDKVGGLKVKNFQLSTKEKGTGKKGLLRVAQFKLKPELGKINDELESDLRQRLMQAGAQPEKMVGASFEQGMFRVVAKGKAVKRRVEVSGKKDDWLEDAFGLLDEALSSKIPEEPEAEPEAVEEPEKKAKEEKEKDGFADFADAIFELSQVMQPDLPSSEAGTEEDVNGLLEKIKVETETEKPGKTRIDLKREEWEVVDDLTPLLKTFGLPEGSELMSALFLKAAQRAKRDDFSQLRAEEGEADQIKNSADFVGKYGKLMSRFGKLFGKELDKQRQAESIKLADLLLLLVKAILYYIKQMMIEEFREYFEELGIDVEKLKQDDLLKLFADTEEIKKKGEKKEKVARDPDQVRTVQEADEDFELRSELFKDIIQVSALEEEDKNRLRQDVDYLQELNKREREGEELKAEEQRQKAEYGAHLQKELKKIPQAQEILLDINYKLVRQAENLGKVTGEEKLDWLFGEGEAEAESKAGESRAEVPGEPPEEPPEDGEGEAEAEGEPEKVTLAELNIWIGVIEAEVGASKKEGEPLRKKRAKEALSSFSGEQAVQKAEEAFRLHADMVKMRGKLLKIYNNASADEIKDQELSAENSKTAREVYEEFKDRRQGWEASVRFAREEARAEAGGGERRRTAAGMAGELLIRIDYELGLDRQRFILEHIPIKKHQDFINNGRKLDAYLKQLKKAISALGKKEQQGIEFSDQEKALIDQAWSYYAEAVHSLWKDKVDDVLGEERTSFFGRHYDVFKKRLDRELVAKGYFEILRDPNHPDFIEAEDVIDKYFREVMELAEEDTMSEFDEREIHQIIAEFEIELKDRTKSKDVSDEYKSRHSARRHMHNVNVRMSQGADLVELNKISKTFGNSYDLDIMGRSIRGLDAAVQLMDPVFRTFSQSPRFKGHIPQELLYTIGSGKVKDGAIIRLEGSETDKNEVRTIVGKVADQLVEYSEAGLLTFQGMNGKRRTIQLESREEALELATTSLKIFAATMRASEHHAETPMDYETGQSELRTAPYKGIAEAMNPYKELARRFEMRGEAPEVLWRIVEESDTNAQAGMWTRTEQNKILGKLNPRRGTGFTSVFTNWRSVKSTERMRKLGLALGLEIYHTKDNPLKRAELVALTAARDPGSVAFTMPTLCWEWADTGQKSERFQGDYQLYSSSEGLSCTRTVGVEGRQQYQRGRRGFFARESTANDLRAYGETRALLDADYGRFVGGITKDTQPQKLRDPIVNSRWFGLDKRETAKKGRFEPRLSRVEAYEALTRRFNLQAKKEARIRAFTFKLAEVYGSKFTELGIGRMPSSINPPEQPPSLKLRLRDRDEDEGYEAQLITWKKECQDWQNEWDRWESSVYGLWEGKGGLQEKLKLVSRFGLVRYKEKALRFEEENGDTLLQFTGNRKLDVNHRLFRKFDKPKEERNFESGLSEEERRLRRQYMEFEGEYNALRIIADLRRGNLKDAQGRAVINIGFVNNSSFTSEDLEMAKFLVNLGGENAAAGVKQLAEQEMHEAFHLDDFDMSMTDFDATGSDGALARRFNDGALAGSAFGKLVEMWNSLGIHKDKFNLLGTGKKLVEQIVAYRDAHAHLGETEKQDYATTQLALLVKDFFKTDEFIEGKWYAGNRQIAGQWWNPLSYVAGPVGMLAELKIPGLGRLAKSTSKSQRRMGGDVASWTAAEVYRLIQEAAPFIGRDNTQRLSEMLDGRLRNGASLYFRRLALPALVGFGIYGGYNGVRKGLVDVLGQALKDEMGGNG